MAMSRFLLAAYTIKVPTQAASGSGSGSSSCCCYYYYCCCCSKQLLRFQKHAFVFSSEILKPEELAPLRPYC